MVASSRLQPNERHLKRMQIRISIRCRKNFHFKNKWYIRHEVTLKKLTLETLTEPTCQHYLVNNTTVLFINRFHINYYSSCCLFMLGDRIYIVYLEFQKTMHTKKKICLYKPFNDRNSSSIIKILFVFDRTISEDGFILCNITLPPTRENFSSTRRKSRKQ